MGRREVYISADVEADGPIPGPFSMLSFGMAVCGTGDHDGFTAHDPATNGFYAELKPISDDFDPRASAVGGLDRERLITGGQDPAAAMNAASTWLKEAAAGATPVFVAYPLGFDWMWLYWYFVRYADHGSPFGHSRHLDIKTLYAAKAGALVTRSTKGQMPTGLLSERPHTHNALDDAVEQAELFQNLMAWDGKPGPERDDDE